MIHTIFYNEKNIIINNTKTRFSDKKNIKNA